MDEFLYRVQTRYLFHCYIRIKIPAVYPESQLDELFELLEHVDRQYNSYQPDSYFDRINQNAGTFVRVDAETIHILNLVKKLSVFFNGRYAITIMPLVRLWGFYKNEQHRVPTQEELNQVLPLVNDNLIEIRDDEVRIQKGQEIVTGSFIKAYAVGKLLKRMRELNIDDAIINAGGSTITSINNKSHPKWQIDVEDAATSDPLFVLNIANTTYSTSAQGDSFVQIDGKRYGHILNPQTGYPSTNKMVGIITENTLLGDMISTGLFNETPEGFLLKMRALKKQFPVEGFLMDDSDHITQTPGFCLHCEDDNA